MEYGKLFIDMAKTALIAVFAAAIIAAAMAFGGFAGWFWFGVITMALVPAFILGLLGKFWGGYGMKIAGAISMVIYVMLAWVLISDLWNAPSRTGQNTRKALEHQAIDKDVKVADETEPIGTGFAALTTRQREEAEEEVTLLYEWEVQHPTASKDEKEKYRLEIEQRNTARIDSKDWAKSEIDRLDRRDRNASKKPETSQVTFFSLFVHVRTGNATLDFVIGIAIFLIILTLIATLIVWVLQKAFGGGSGHRSHHEQTKLEKGAGVAYYSLIIFLVLCVFALAFMGIGHLRGSPSPASDVPRPINGPRVQMIIPQEEFSPVRVSTDAAGQITVQASGSYVKTGSLNQASNGRNTSCVPTVFCLLLLC